MVLRYNKIKDFKNTGLKCVPMMDIIDIKDGSFYNTICELYNKYSNQIRDNIKKINSPSVNKSVLRVRALIGNSGNLQVANNVYVDLHPVFYLFGMLLPYISRVLQVDMYGMFEQLSNISVDGGRQLHETEMKLMKMTMMNDVKILDLDDVPLTYEQQINVLVYMNIFLHIIANSLFKIDKESLPKMIEQSVLNQFNSIIDTKFKLPVVYDKLHDNDTYHCKVIRKVLLSFGIRPVRMKLKNVPANIRGGITSSSMSVPTISTGGDDLDEFVDSVTIPYDKLDHVDFEADDVDVAGQKVLSIKKFLEKYTKVVSLDNKLYWSQFDRAFGLLPVFINRKDTKMKKDYEQLLLAQTECCETKFNTRKVDISDLICTTLDSNFSINGVKYSPFALQGVFIGNSESTGFVEDIEFLFINPLNEFPPDAAFAGQCKPVSELLKKFDEEFFCGGKTSKNSYNCRDSTGAAVTSIDSILQSVDSTCCDYSMYDEFKRLITGHQLGLLYMSNKSCSHPILVSMDGHMTIDIASTNVKIVTFEQIKCLIQSSVTSVIYITDIDC